MLDVAIRVLAHALTPLFLLGMLGATVVVAITFLKDVVQFFSEEETAATHQE